MLRSLMTVGSIVYILISRRSIPITQYSFKAVAKTLENLGSHAGIIVIGFLVLFISSFNATPFAEAT